MRTAKVGMTALVALALLALAFPEKAAAAEAPDCTTSYLLCLNVASQEEGAFWRTIRETECGVAWYGCMRRKANGA